MTHISGRIRIAAPLELVFDTVADSRNEPSFNQAMTAVELLTPLPIGQGTRFRARMGKAGMEMLVELTEFDRPHRLGSRTTSSVMETSGELPSPPRGTTPSWAGTGRCARRGGSGRSGRCSGPLVAAWSAGSGQGSSTNSKTRAPPVPPDGSQPSSRLAP
ncbi:MAG: SRPBCC family protein [Mycobacteriaceae bacterium]